VRPIAGVAPSSDPSGHLLPDGEKKYAAMPGAYPKANFSSQTRESKTAPKAPFS